MKYLLVFASIVMIGCSGCMKNEKGCTNQRPETEEAQIQAYATANGIAATKHSSGIYYQIVNPGSGPTPTLTSKIYINYTGRFLTGAIFEQGSNSLNDPWMLQGLIEGWQIGVPLIKKGGKIKLIIPSAYAYGCNGRGAIPSNTVLHFDIDLIDVQ
jgi:FKBP-type peptidyl-prolyl cis-trans isomerase FkpA